MSYKFDPLKITNEDELPQDLTRNEYDRWYEASFIKDGVRVGPAVSREIDTTTINPDAPRPGPFAVHHDWQWTVVDAVGEEVIGCELKCGNDTYGPALARRVAAALNFCEGLATEWLERLPGAHSEPSMEQCEVCEDRQRAADQPQKGNCGYGFAIDPAEVCSRKSCGHRADFHSRYDHCKECQCRQFLLPMGGDVSQGHDSSPLAAPESDFDSEKVGQHGLEDKNAVQGDSGLRLPKKWVIAERFNKIADRVVFGSPPIGSESVVSRLAAIERQVEKCQQWVLNTNQAMITANSAIIEARNDLAQLTAQMSEVLGRLDLIEQLPIIIEGRKH